MAHRRTWGQGCGEQKEIKKETKRRKESCGKEEAVCDAVNSKGNINCGYWTHAYVFKKKKGKTPER